MIDDCPQKHGHMAHTLRLTLSICRLSAKISSSKAEARERNAVI
jgi:hypothetical protein